jgi:predicted dehydrogenase
MRITRREFGAAAAVLALASTAKSYSQIMGANDRLNFAVIGLRSRAYAHLASLKANNANARISHVCDVDSVTLAKFAADTQKKMGVAPATEKDFRNILALKDVDAITIATPDHWHAPMAIAGLQAGKHVYVEKPCSHNPAEGVLLVEAQKKYKKLVQMGTQRRSSPLYIDAVRQIQDGLIGQAYSARAWYSNTRTSIGIGKVVSAPARLDWDLWQGPAPRQPYKDNFEPYNWHWFKTWGTGEALNNGTHEVDVCRWALGVDLPQRVTALGGRYQFKDDWQFYDTLSASFDYGDKLISWESASCNGVKLYGRDRGAVILGTTGSIVLDPGGYELYNLKGVKTSEYKAAKAAAASSDLTGADDMTDSHFANFIAAIRTGEKLNQPVDSGNISVSTLQLANIAWEVKRELRIDPASGHVLQDDEAMNFWGRDYEKGWAPHL